MVIAGYLWGNMSSGLLFCPGTRYYGLTRRGTYVEYSKVGKPIVEGKSRIWKISARYGKCL